MGDPGATVSECVFVENSATEGGALVTTWGGPTTITDCVFERNNAQMNGGAAYNNISNPTFRNCEFIGNTAPYGGAIRNVLAFPGIINCVFTDNMAEFPGGAINTVNATPVISGSQMWCNIPDAVAGNYNNGGNNCINDDCTVCGTDDCSSDINGDGTVDGADFGLLLAAWTGSAECENSDCGGADLNDDGRVNGSDIGLLLSDWALICTP